MVRGACDVAAWGDLLGGNHHPTVGCTAGIGVDGAHRAISPSWLDSLLVFGSVVIAVGLVALRTSRGDSSSVVTIQGSRSLRPPSMCCSTTTVACRCSRGHLRPFRAWLRFEPGAKHSVVDRQRHASAEGMAGRWPTRIPSTTLPIRCTPSVKTPLRLDRRLLATDVYAAAPPRATRVRARRRLCNRQPADL